jgi:hypothetical protein
MAQRKNDGDEFIVPAYDLDGRSVSLLLRVPPSINRALGEIVESRRFPFKAKGDAIRWCINHGIKTLEFTEPPSSILPVVSMSLLLIRTHLHMKMLADFFTKLDAVMIQLSTHSYLHERSRKVIKAIEELVLCMPSSHDRCLYHGELRRRWGHLLLNSEPPQVGEAADAEPSGRRGASDGR